MANADEIINAYVVIRDQKKELADRHKEELKPFNDKLGMLEAGLLKILNEAGGDSLKAKSGTAYLKERTSVKTTDWDNFIEFVKENDMYHMLVRGAAKDSVNEYINANGECPPGITISSDLTVGVRRK